MENDIFQYSLDNVQKRFSNNLKKLMDKMDMNQKQFAEKMEISESTLSGYVKGNKSPSFSFLISLKEQFQDISLDHILFDEIMTKKEPTIHISDSVPVGEFLKYKGTYYLYYLDVNKKINSKLSSQSVHESIDLKFGVLYVNPKIDLSNSSSVDCIAAFGIKRREEAQSLKNDIELLDNYDQIYERIKGVNQRGVYLGQLTRSQMHIFISLTRAIDAKDNAFIIFHHASMDKEYSSGGLGTINSVSTGRDSDPIVQLIALSKDFAYISDEQIKSQLRFATPDIQVKGQRETAEILRLAKSIYHQENSSMEDMSDYSQFSEHNKETLLTSYLEYLNMRNLENNRLWFGRVSNRSDADWDQMLKDSSMYHEKRQKGDKHDFSTFDTAANYTLY